MDRRSERARRVRPQTRGRVRRVDLFEDCKSALIFPRTDPRFFEQTGFGWVDVAIDCDSRGLGDGLYETHKSMFHRWLERNVDETSPIVCGYSLGAALAQWTISDYREKLRFVELYNAPGISVKAADKFDSSRVEKLTYRIASGDPVSMSGETVLFGGDVMSTLRLNELGVAQSVPTAAITSDVVRVQEGCAVWLSGVDSTAPNGGALEYRWDLTGSSATPGDALTDGAESLRARTTNAVATACRDSRLSSLSDAGSTSERFDAAFEEVASTSVWVGDEFATDCGADVWSEIEAALVAVEASRKKERREPFETFEESNAFDVWGENSPS